MIKVIKKIQDSLKENDDMLIDIIGEILQDLENGETEKAKNTYHYHLCSDVIKTDDYSLNVLWQIGKIIG